MFVVPLVIAVVMLGIYTPGGRQQLRRDVGRVPRHVTASWPSGSLWESRAVAIARITRRPSIATGRRSTRSSPRLDEDRVRQGEARRRQLPEIGEMFHRARQLAPTLWERGPRDGDFLHLRVGTAELPSLSTVDDRPRAGATDSAPELPGSQPRFATVEDVPVALDVRRSAASGVCGPDHWPPGSLGGWCSRPRACTARPTS